MVFGGYSPERVRNTEERRVEHVCRVSRERLVGMALEQNAETLVSQLFERVVNPRVASPFIQGARQLCIPRRILQRVLIGPNGEVDLTFVECDATEQK